MSKTRKRPGRKGPGRRKRPWPPALVLCALAAVGGVRADVAVQYVGREQGLPSTQVHAVVEDADGFLWFAGPSGLARYDGWRVVTFGQADGLSSHGLRALALDRDGRLWIGTDAGVDVRERDGRFRAVTDAETWRFGIVDAIVAGPEGDLWIAAAMGLLRWTARAGLEPIENEALAGRHVAALAFDDGGHLWAAVTGVGVVRRRGRRWMRVQAPGLERVGTVRSLAPSARGGVWVGGDEGVVEIDGAGSRVLPIADSPAGMVSAVIETGDELWLGAGGELRQLRRYAQGWRLAAVVRDTSLINAFGVDRQGNLWAATDGVGVAKMSALRRAVSAPATPCRTQVFSIRPDAGGGYLIGGDRCSWSASDDGQPLDRIAELDRIKVWDLLRDADGTLWAATEEGLYRGAAGRPVARLDASSESLEASGRVLLERGDGLWVGTLAGLVEVVGRRVTDRPGPDGRPLGYVYTLEEGPGGRVWIGTLGRGLWREGPDGALEPVASAGLTPSGNTYSIAFTAGGGVAVAQDDRLIRLAGGVSKTLPPATADAVAAWSLAVDGEGDLWAGGSSGLVRYRRGVPVSRLRATMGMSGEEFTTSRSLLVTADGRLLCGLDGGLTIVEAAELERFADPPEVRLIDLHWANAEVEETPASTTVSEGRWTLDATVAAPWFVDERSLSYRHRVRGFDPDWSPEQAGDDHRIRYTGLPAGTYTLEAQAHSPLVGWGPAADLLTLYVTPPWWRRPWALLLGAVLLATGLAGLWRWRTQHLVRRGRELEVLVERRTGELRDALAHVRHIAAHDELTGLPNQRTFWEQARRHQALACRSATDLSLVVVDLDEFKKINDTWGHRAGDQVLASVARRLEDLSRDSDLLARYGGEEFVVLMPETSEEAAIRAAERLRGGLAAEPFEALPGVEIAVTGSFGVSRLENPDDDVEALFRRADAAVYQAKRTKNAVAAWDSDTTYPSTNGLPISTNGAQ